MCGISLTALRSLGKQEEEKEIVGMESNARNIQTLPSHILVQFHTVQDGQVVHQLVRTDPYRNEKRTIIPPSLADLALPSASL